MFCISIAGLTVGIDNKYDYVKDLAAEHLTEGEPLFTVSADDSEIDSEVAVCSEFTRGYGESIVIYRHIADRLPEYDAVVFHGAIIASDTLCYAITARSGVGKTTHIRNWLKSYEGRVHVLNGDKPILRFINGELYACATPWKGKERYGVNEMLPLKGIGILSRSDKNSASPITPQEGMMSIINQIYIPKDGKNAPMALAIMDKILTGTPLYSLKVNMEAESSVVAARAFGFV